MAKKIESYIKLQVPAAEANPSPPVGPALGQHGVNIQEFCKSFNGRTEKIEMFRHTWNIGNISDQIYGIFEMLGPVDNAWTR